MKSKLRKSTISETVSTARIYALISVLCAHLPFLNSVVGVAFDKIGTIGVVVFLISSGYYFVPDKFNGFLDLLKRKGKTICVPWIVLGSFVWVYNVILSDKFRSILGYLKWIFGNGTYLYYVPILLLCFIICYKASTRILVCLVCLNVVSIVLTSSGILTSVINGLHITNYLNVFNWIGFFALGMLLRNVPEIKIQQFLTKVRLPAFAVFVMAFILVVKYESVDTTYFSYLGIPFELLGSIFVFSLSTISVVRIKFFKYLSESSYTIYLTHMVFVGVLDSVLGRNVFLQMVSPVVIVFIVFVLLMIGNVISNKLKLNDFYCAVTGLRIKRQ